MVMQEEGLNTLNFYLGQRVFGYLYTLLCFGLFKLNCGSFSPLSVIRLYSREHGYRTLLRTKTTAQDPLEQLASFRFLTKSRADCLCDPTSIRPNYQVYVASLS